MRRRDDACVDVDAAIGADGEDLLALDRAEQLGLERERELADLVEEERAAGGRAEEPLASLIGAGERAALVPEQVALDQRVGDRAHVHGDERSGGALGALVHRAGDELLAGAALAEQEDVRRRRGDLHDHVAEVRHLASALAEQRHGVTVASKERPQAGVLAVEPVVPRDVLDLGLQIGERHRLEHVVVRAAAKRLHGGFDRCVCRHDEHEALG